MRSYSEDLHTRVVEYVKSGHTYRETVEVFGVSPRAICRWRKLDREGKSLKYESVPRSPHRVNYEKLLAYVKGQSRCVFKGDFSLFFSRYCDYLDGFEASGSEI